MSNAPVITFRTTPDERNLLELAAATAKTSLSEFVRRQSLEAAEMMLLETRNTELSATDWERFESWMDAPTREIPALQELARQKPAWK